MGWGTRLYLADPRGVSNLSQHKGPQACSQCLQVVFDVMQCDEDIKFYHIVKEGQGTEGRVSLISLSLLWDLQEGDSAAVRGINGKDQKPIVKSSQRELAPKGFIPPKKLLQISFERALEYRNILRR